MALIVLAGVAAYSNSLQGAFVFDDIASIAQNKSIRSLWRLDQVLLPVEKFDYYRPVLNLSLALCYSIGGLDVAPYHILNLGIHLGAALTLFGLVRRTLLLDPHDHHLCKASTTLALVASLLWVLHPLQTESVTYVIQRCEAMYGLFSLLSLYCVVRGAASARTRWWYGGAVAACALGMGSKEATVVVPFLILLYDRTFLASSLRDAFAKRWGLYAALALTWGMLVPAILVSTLSQSPRPTEPITIWEYARSQFGVVVHYLRLGAWPDALCLDYRWPVAQSAGQIAPPAALIGALLSAVLWALGRWPKCAFLGAAFFIALAPSSSVVPIADLAFEHRMYLPLAPLIVAMVLGAYAILRGLSRTRSSWESARRALLGVLVVAIAAALGFRTYLRNEDYRSAQRIWEDTCRKAPQNYRAHTNLGRTLRENGNVESAIASFQEALRIKPDYAEAHCNLGVALATQDRVAEAIHHYRKALEVRPGFAEAHYNLGNAQAQQGKVDEAISHFQKAVEFEPNDADSHHNCATALVQAGRIDEAIHHYQRALEINDSDPDTHYNLGLVLTQRGRTDEAIRHYEKALAINPRFFEAHYNLGIALLRQGKAREAIAHWHEALRLQPDQVVLLMQTAWVLATSPDAYVRNGHEAIALAGRAVQLTGGANLELLDVLAAANAEAGRFSVAAAVAKQALEMATDRPDLANALRERWKLYQAGRAFRDSGQVPTPNGDRSP